MMGLAVALPAVCTLLACAGRLVIALQESRTASEAFHLARTDDLTGLPNRRAILREVDKSLEAQEPFGLMLLDLDGFKEVNDTLGHGAGDTLLELVALRVKEALPPTVMLARVGGDEFAILVKNEDEVELLEMAQGIRRTLLAPARIEGLDLAMDASLGIALVEAGDTRAADLLRHLNRSGAELYSADHDEFSRQRLQMGEELRRALHKGQVTAWYQPKVDAMTKDVMGFEALVRWEHPENGTLPPAAFLTVARRSGLMQELSLVVVELAVASAARWRRMGMDLHVAINVAPPELLGGQLLPAIYEALHRSDLPPHAVTVEVTEDSFLADPERARQVLLDVHRHGLKVSVDDYGTGFSSLSYLRDLPISELKLDRSFVSTMSRDRRSSLIVASTIDMAHALDLRVVAEGVEDAETVQELMDMGVDTLQGYRISKPMPATSVVKWVQDSHLPTAPMRIVPGRIPEDGAPDA
jgi:diguanylate cyclase (GGDEF)-like protein